MKTKQWMRQGQSTAEYAIVISVVIAVVVGMQLYVKRGMQAKVKSSADHYTSIGGDFTNAVGTGNIGNTGQYEPYYTAAGTLTTTSNASANVVAENGARISRQNIDEATSRSGVTTTGTERASDDAWN